VHLKSGLIRVVASLEGDNLVVFYYPSASGLIRVVASLEGDNLVVFYYPSAATPLIRPDFRCTEMVKYY
jgi:peroxiredoxin